MQERVSFGLSVFRKASIHPLLWPTWQIERARGRVSVPFPQWLRAVCSYGRPLHGRLRGVCQSARANAQSCRPTAPIKSTIAA